MGTTLMSTEAITSMLHCVVHYSTSSSAHSSNKRTYVHTYIQPTVPVYKEHYRIAGKFLEVKNCGFRIMAKFAKILLHKMIFPGQDCFETKLQKLNLKSRKFLSQYFPSIQYLATNSYLYMLHSGCTYVHKSSNIHTLTYFAVCASSLS